MNRYRNFYTAIAIATLMFGLSVVASAQRRNRSNNDYYGRNTANLSYTVKNLRDNARRFEDVLDRELDRSRYDGTRREDELNRLAGRFKNAAEDLDDEFEGRTNRNSADEARRVVNYGAQLDGALSRSRLAYNNYNLQASWAAIERDLFVIARNYNINYNGVYGRSRGNRRPIGNNGPWGNYPGSIGNGRYNRNLTATIRNLKNNARRFEDRLDDLNGRDRWGRRSSRGDLENLSDRFKNAVDRLDDEYDNGRDFNRSYDEARNVIALGEQLDREISRSRVGSSIRSDWNRIEADLRVLAEAYNIRYNGRNGFGIGDIIRNFPF